MNIQKARNNFKNGKPVYANLLDGTRVRIIGVGPENCRTINNNLIKTSTIKTLDT